MAGRAGGRDPGRVVADLDVEWAGMAGEAGAVSGWAERHLVLRGCVDLGDVLGLVRGGPDEVLGALLRESRAGSVVAARVVLQAMLGKVVLLARADPSVGVDGFVAAMWERIRTYPIERRPRHIAANLALDARKWARREVGGWRRVTPWPPGAGFADVVDRQRARECLDHGGDLALLTAGEVIEAAVELELIDPGAGDLLRAVYADGGSSAAAARSLGTSPAAVRWRCGRAVRRLAGHREELAGRCGCAEPVGVG